MNSEIYTITRLSNELHIDRQNIRRTIKKLDVKALNEDTRAYQNEPLEYDRATFLKLADSFGVSISNTNDIQDDAQKDALIEVLKEQLQVANEEKKELRNLLDQQQQLSMADRNKLQSLELELEATDKKINQTANKKGFFRRLFNL